jgi:hypothetical protein
MSFVRLLMAVPDSAETMKNELQINTAANQFDVEHLDKLIGDMIDGAQLSYTKLSTGSVQSTATITSTGAAVNNETMLLANVTLTAKTSGAVAANGEFNLSATPTTQAANIAAAINAVAGLSSICQATSALGVVTVTAVWPGKAGNGLQISESLTNVTVTAFASGSDGSQVAVNFGAAS